MSYVHLLAACLLLSLSTVAQTTVCIIRKDTLYTGCTDSAHIQTVKGFNFFYGGPFDPEVTATIKEAAANAVDFTTCANSCAQAVKELYLEQFSHIRSTDPTVFDQKIMGNRLSITVAQICLFGIENMRPVLIVVVFYMNKGVKHPVVITYNITHEPMATCSLGPHQRHKGIVGNMDSGGPVAELKKNIGYETDGPVDGSGPPIDILVLTKQVRRWIRK